MNLQDELQFMEDMLLYAKWLSDAEKQHLEEMKHILEQQVHEAWQRMKARRNFNPPERWELIQDKRRNTSPIGRGTYLYKARKIKSLARSTHTHSALHKGKENSNAQQCKHTFQITVARCAPCSGYNTECEHYERNDAADTKHGDSRW